MTAYIHTYTKSKRESGPSFCIIKRKNMSFGLILLPTGFVYTHQGNNSNNGNVKSHNL